MNRGDFVCFEIPVEDTSQVQILKPGKYKRQHDRMSRACADSCQSIHQSHTLGNLKLQSVINKTRVPRNSEAHALGVTRLLKSEVLHNFWKGPSGRSPSSAINSPVVKFSRRYTLQYVPLPIRSPLKIAVPLWAQ